MIKPSELRIGNWIMESGSGKYFKWTLEHFWEEYKKPDKSYYFEPIPLTPEILAKCGLIDNKIFPDNEYFSIEGESLLFEGNFTAVDNIKHLHQLQNLYFALTGEELNVNL